MFCHSPPYILHIEMRQRVAQHAGRTTISECTPSRLTLSHSAWGKTFLQHWVQGWLACGVSTYTTNPPNSASPKPNFLHDPVFCSCARYLIADKVFTIMCAMPAQYDDHHHHNDNVLLCMGVLQHKARTKVSSQRRTRKVSLFCVWCMYKKKSLLHIENSLRVYPADYWDISQQRTRSGRTLQKLLM